MVSLGDRTARGIKLFAGILGRFEPFKNLGALVRRWNFVTQLVLGLNLDPKDVIARGSCLLLDDSFLAMLSACGDVDYFHWLVVLV